MKLLQPSAFHGTTASNPEQWLGEMERYFIASRGAIQPDHTSVQLAATYLKDSASLWYSSVSADEEARKNIATWDLFKAVFRARFMPFAASRGARSALWELKQKSNVTGYTNEFLKLIQQVPDMKEQEKLDKYIHGLLPHIAMEVDRLNPTTIQEAMNYASREEIRQSTGAGRKSNLKPSYHFHRDHSNHSTGNFRSSAVDPNRMDISNVEMQEAGGKPELSSAAEEVLLALSQVMNINRPSAPRREPSTMNSNFGPRRVNDLSRAEYDRLAREGKCFRCKQTGHLARNCPTDGLRRLN